MVNDRMGQSDLLIVISGAKIYILELASTENNNMWWHEEEVQV